MGVFKPDDIPVHRQWSNVPINFGANVGAFDFRIDFQLKSPKFSGALVIKYPKSLPTINFFRWKAPVRILFSSDASFSKYLLYSVYYNLSDSRGLTLQSEMNDHLLPPALWMDLGEHVGKNSS